MKVKTISYSEAFELFWCSYPPRFNESRQLWIRADKPGAWLEWQKLTNEQMIAVLNLVSKEKASKWTSDARKWLHHKPWEDDIARLKEEYRRPGPEEFQKVIATLSAAFPPIPKTRLSNYAVNKLRNMNLDRLETEANR